MKANELIDELNKFTELGGDLFFSICGDFIRQQQAEIDKLKEINSNFVNLIQLLREEVNALRDKLNAD